jgi:Protein of unknown function (DUF1190)
MLTSSTTKERMSAGPQFGPLNCFVVGILLTLGLPPATADTSALKLRFATEAQCQRTLGNGAACLRWFAEADRRSQREGPRFLTRSECEALFGACGIGGSGGGARQAEFRPILSGIEVTIVNAKPMAMEPLVGTAAAQAPRAASLVRASRGVAVADPTPMEPIRADEPKAVGPTNEVLTYPVPPHRRPKRLPDAMIR